MRKKEGAPVPIEIKKARGTGNSTRERRKSEIMIPASESLPAAPPGFSERAVEAWGRIAMQLKSVNLFFPSCYEYLETYCRALEVREAASELLNGEPFNLETGKVKPAWKVFNEASALMISAGAKLGLSPVDKTKISSLIIDGNKDKNKQKKIGTHG